MPKVTVGIPAFNAEATVLPAVTSALAQTLRDLEVVVVDDGSRDATVDILDRIGDPRLRVVRHASNQGIASARNTVLAEARGEHVAWLDADDVCRADRVQRQVDVLERNRNAVICGSWTYLSHGPTDPGRLQRWACDPEDLDCMLVFSNPLSTSSVTIALDRIRERGPVPYFSPDEVPAEDYAFWVDLARVGSLHMVRRPLVRRFETGTGAATTMVQRQQRAVRRIHATLLQDLGLTATDADLDVHGLLTPPHGTDARRTSDLELTDWVATLVDANDKSNRYPRDRFRSVAYGKLARALRAGSGAPHARARALASASWQGRSWLARRVLNGVRPQSDD